ncbi:MAG: hypothetical protein R1F54_07495 [Candidatus Zeuxoniibacter abyssi]|nr:MAG: hypothetical protein R1F54_07495 [Candidatus Persebacteraceae bacterium AB1(2)]
MESLVRDVIRDGEVATREDIAKLDFKIDKLDTKVDFKVDKLDTKVSIILNIMIPMMTAIFGVIVLMAFKHFCKPYRRPQRGNPLTTGAFWAARMGNMSNYGMI